MTKYERALVRRSVKCSICVPIFRPWRSGNCHLCREINHLRCGFDTDEDILTSLQDNQALLNLIMSDVWHQRLNDGTRRNDL